MGPHGCYVPQKQKRAGGITGALMLTLFLIT